MGKVALLVGVVGLFSGVRTTAWRRLKCRHKSAELLMFGKKFAGNFLEIGKFPRNVWAKMAALMAGYAAMHEDRELRPFAVDALAAIGKCRSFIKPYL